MNRRVALAAFIALVTAAAAWRLTRSPPPTDEELIQALFGTAVEAAEARKASEAIGGLSERFSGQGLDRHDVKRLVAATTLRGGWLLIRIAGLRVEVTGDRARAVLDLVASRAGPGKALAELLPADANAWRIDCRLERERDGWRVVGASWVEESLLEALAGPEQEPAGTR
jgi:hypothetical protein